MALSPAAVTIFTVTAVPFGWSSHQPGAGAVAYTERGPVQGFATAVETAPALADIDTTSQQEYVSATTGRLRSLAEAEVRTRLKDTVPLAPRFLSDSPITSDLCREHRRDSAEAAGKMDAIRPRVQVFFIRAWGSKCWNHP